MSTQTAATRATMERARIDIGRTDRLFITGAAGGGKTRLLATKIIPSFAYFPPVILDPKGDFPPIGGIRRTNKYRRGEAQILHIPRREQSPIMWEEIIDRILDHGNHTIVIDDMYAINGGNANPRPNLLWAISGGRSIGCPVYTGCQRPSRLPVSVLSESEHYFVFPLRTAVDNKTITDNTSPAVGRHIAGLGMHDYVYYKATPPHKVIVMRG